MAYKISAAGRQLASIVAIRFYYRDLSRVCEMADATTDYHPPYMRGPQAQLPLTVVSTRRGGNLGRPGPYLKPNEL